MSRLLKFRYWDGVIEAMFYSDSFGTETPNGNNSQVQTLVHFFEKARYYASANGQYAYLNPDNTIMQSIGVKDSQDKDIYEGDIVNTKVNRYVIEYSEEKCGFVARGLFYSKAVVNPRDLEGGFIIGNIYGNPELLKE